MKTDQDDLIGKQALLYLLRQSHRRRADEAPIRSDHGGMRGRLITEEKPHSHWCLTVALLALAGGLLLWNLKLEIRLGKLEGEARTLQETGSQKLKQLDERLNLFMEQQREHNIRETTERIESLSLHDVELTHIQERLREQGRFPESVRVTR